MATDPPVAFLVPLPGGRVARVPLALLLQHVDPSATAHHGLGDPTPADEMLTFSPSAETGEWHTEWELGACQYTDEAGQSRSGVQWHRHPLATEYAEIYKP